MWKIKTIGRHLLSLWSEKQKSIVSKCTSLSPFQDGRGNSRKVYWIVVFWDHCIINRITCSYDTYAPYLTWKIYSYIVYIIFYESLSGFLWKISFWVNSGHTQGISGPKSLVVVHKFEQATSTYHKWLSKTNLYVLYVYLLAFLNSCTRKTQFWGILGPGMSLFGS